MFLPPEISTWEYFAFEILCSSTHHSDKKRRFYQNPRPLAAGGSVYSPPGILAFSM